VREVRDRFGSGVGGVGEEGGDDRYQGEHRRLPAAVDAAPEALQREKCQRRREGEKTEDLQLGRWEHCGRKERKEPGKSTEAEGKEG
jgi:hypothetical protein